VRTIQVVVYSALGVPALGIFVAGIGFVIARANGRLDLSMLFGKVLVGSLYLGVAGAGLALVAGLLLAGTRRDPSA